MVVRKLSTRRVSVFLPLFLGVIISLIGRVQADAIPAIGVRVGEIYPDFFLPDLDGKYLRLSDFRGKKVFLFHFASW